MRKLLLIAGSLALLSGCVSGAYRDGRQATTPHFGEAVQANIKAMTAAAHNGTASTDGARAAIAVNRYTSNATHADAAPAASHVGENGGGS